MCAAQLEPILFTILTAFHKLFILYPKHFTHASPRVPLYARPQRSACPWYGRLASQRQDFLLFLYGSYVSMGGVWARRGGIPWDLQVQCSMLSWKHFSFLYGDMFT